MQTMQQRHIPAHYIADKHMEDAAAPIPRAFAATQDCLRPGQHSDDVAREFFRMTPNHAVPSVKHSSVASSTQKRFVRQVSVPFENGVAAPQDDIASQLAAALAANAELQTKLDIQSAHAHLLEEKVVTQGRTVSALCVEVDRLTKDNEELSERLAMQMEQRRIETEQFKHHLAMFKATSQGRRAMQLQSYQPSSMYGNQPRISLPGSSYPPRKLAAVAPTTASSPVRRMSTAMGVSTTISGGDREHTANGAPQEQPRKYPLRRMSTGAAATCA